MFLFRKIGPFGRVLVAKPRITLALISSPALLMLRFN